MVMATAPDKTESTMRVGAELGIKHVWMHRGPGTGSVPAATTSYGRQHGITVIYGGCPLMFGPTADLGHKVMRVIYRGHVPKTVGPLARVARAPVHPTRGGSHGLLGSHRSRQGAPGPT